MWGIFFGFYKTRHILLSDSANCTVLRVVVLTQYRRVTDGQTDRQTDTIAIASSALRALRRALRRAVKIIASCKGGMFFWDTVYYTLQHCIVHCKLKLLVHISVLCVQNCKYHYHIQKRCYKNHVLHGNMQGKVANMIGVWHKWDTKEFKRIKFSWENTQMNAKLKTTKQKNNFKFWFCLVAVLIEV